MPIRPKAECCYRFKLTSGQNPTPVSTVATEDHALLGGHRESRLKNPLRKICTAGSVRGGDPRRATGELTRARTWKRRQQPKNTYRSPDLLYSESAVTSSSLLTHRTVKTAARIQQSQIQSLSSNCVWHVHCLSSASRGKRPHL